MQVYVDKDGNVEGVGSINHAELARLQAAAKKRKAPPKRGAKDEPGDESEDDLLDESEDKTGNGSKSTS